MSLSSRTSPAARLALASFALTVWLPLLSRSPYADLTSFYTDHLRNPFGTFLFLGHGLQVYTHPLRDLWEGTRYPFPSKAWGEMPLAYPPGMFLLFSPIVALGWFVPLTSHGYALASMLYLLALAHLSFYAVLRALEGSAPGARLLVALAAWLLLMHVALQGFYDPVYVGCGAWMVHRMTRRDWTGALLWFSAAILLHYRAFALVPLALYAGIQRLRAGELRSFGPAGAGVLGATALSLGSFVLMYPATAVVRQMAASAPTMSASDWCVLLPLTAVAVAVAGWGSDLWIATEVLFCLGLGALDVQKVWWHALLLLFAPLGVGAWGQHKSPGLVRTVLCVWVGATSFLLWRGRINQVLLDVLRSYQAQ